MNEIIKKTPGNRKKNRYKTRGTGEVDLPRTSSFPSSLLPPSCYLVKDWRKASEVSADPTPQAVSDQGSQIPPLGNTESTQMVGPPLRPSA